MIPPGSSERPRDVFLGACDALAGFLQPYGFKYARSRQQLRRKRGPFNEFVSFLSSQYNAAGSYIALRPAVRVECPDLGRWREAHSPESGSFIAGGMLYTVLGTGYADFNLADEGTRESVIEEVRDRLVDQALPWIDRIESTDDLIGDALHGEVPGVWIERLVDYLVYIDRRPDAQRVLQAWLDRHRDKDVSGFLGRLRPVLERHGLAGDIDTFR